MAKRTVVWTETAAHQRKEILKYWVKRNGSTTYAEKLIKLTAEQIKVIQKNPRLFKKADFPNTHISALGHFRSFTSTQGLCLLSQRFGTTGKIQKNFSIF